MTMTPDNFVRLLDFGRADALALATRLATSDRGLTGAEWAHGTEQAKTYGPGWATAYTGGASMVIGAALAQVFGTNPQASVAWLAQVVGNADELEDEDPETAACLRLGVQLAAQGLVVRDIKVDLAVDLPGVSSTTQSFGADDGLVAVLRMLNELLSDVARDSDVPYLDAFVAVLHPYVPIVALDSTRPVLGPPLADAG